MQIFAHLFVRLKGLVIDPQFCAARATGGASLDKVLNQDETAEFYSIGRNCFSLPCSEKFTYRFQNPVNYLNFWYRNLTNSIGDVNAPVNSDFTIALQRRDYANLYWSLNDWYMTYLQMTFFNKTVDETNILLVDAHPQSILDPVWSVLFNSSVQFSRQLAKAKYSDMVWGIQGHSFLLEEYSYRWSPPLLTEFRRFFLTRFRLDSQLPVNCSTFSVLFIWRRDYVAHPRNPRGLIQRKIANEEELLNDVKRRHPNFRVGGVQLDKLSMKKQLMLINQADILVGMHGAGLAHALMLKSHSAMIELVPRYSSSQNNHFANLAHWRNISYIKWINPDQQNERFNYLTYIPLADMEKMISAMHTHMCNEDVSLRTRNPLYINPWANPFQKRSPFQKN